NQVGLQVLWEPDSSTEDWRVLSVADSVGRLFEYAYDSEDRIVRVSEATSALEASYAYNANGNLIEATDSVGSTESYEYDFDSARVAGYWSPEGQLGPACEQMCAPSSSSCDAGGACDGPVQAAWQTCLGSCGSCADTCNE